MSVTYATKARLISMSLPIAVVLGFVLVGYHNTRSLFALSNAPAGVSLYVDQAQYHVGDDISVTIANASSTPISITNNCPNQPLAVYREENGAWVSLSAAASITKCTGEPRNYTIPADRSLSTDYQYWPTLFNQPGHYRIVAPIDSYSSGPSVSFTILSD